MATKKFPVEASHILMFARAVNDPNPIYSDAEYARKTEVGAILAPPTFTQSSAQFDPDYFLRPKIGQPWFGSGKEPSGAPRAAGARASRGLPAPLQAASTRSSTSSTTGRSSRATCSPPRTSPARPGSAKAGAAASCTSRSPSPSTATSGASSSSPRAAWACAPSA